MGAVVFETDKKQNYRELRATAEGAHYEPLRSNGKGCAPVVVWSCLIRLVLIHACYFLLLVLRDATPPVASRNTPCCVTQHPLLRSATPPVA